MESAPAYYFKLNIDDYCLDDLGRGGIEGVVRDANDQCITGFSKSLLNATNNQIELLALNGGLKLVELNNFRSVEINIVSVEVILMIKNGNLHYNVVIDDCRSKRHRLGSPTV